MERFGKRVRYAGHEFIEVESSDLPLMDGHPKGVKVLLPYRPPDDKREFPGEFPLEDAYFWLSSGVAAHKINRDIEEIDLSGYQSLSLDDFLKEQKSEGVRASDLDIFREDDWYGECFQVLQAHGWLDKGGNLSSHVINHVNDVYGHSVIKDAKDKYEEKWSAYIGELAAIRLAVPLSRLWYAANMKSLYFIHYDDLRLGYLWAEYKLRMQHELNSFRGKKNFESAGRGGEERAKSFQPARQAILVRMRSYLSRGQTVANAAKLAHKAGFGKSPEANRKLWYRYTSK